MQWPPAHYNHCLHEWMLQECLGSLSYWKSSTTVCILMSQATIMHHVSLFHEAENVPKRLSLILMALSTSEQSFLCFWVRRAVYFGVWAWKPSVFINCGKWNLSACCHQALLQVFCSCSRLFDHLPLQNWQAFLKIHSSKVCFLEFSVTLFFIKSLLSDLRKEFCRMQI